MIEKLEKVLEPFANKLAQQRHLQAISSGMMMPLGLIVIGSLFLIVANPPINLDLVDLHTGNIFLKALIGWKQFAVANYDVLTLLFSRKLSNEISCLWNYCYVYFLNGVSTIKRWWYFNKLFRS